MTNAEKYLKDGVSEYDFLDFLLNEGIGHSIQANYNYIKDLDLIRLLQQPVKPSLTEDERVILKNLNKEIYTTIGRDRNGLYLFNDSDNCYREYAINDLFGGLFQFIKERRRILY